MISNYSQKFQQKKLYGNQQQQKIKANIAFKQALAFTSKQGKLSKGKHRKQQQLQKKIDSEPKHKVPTK